jgi:Fe-S cluster biosynthesis and repair protein YggX
MYKNIQEYLLLLMSILVKWSVNNMSIDWKEQIKINEKYSIKLCELLNKSVKNNNVEYFPYVSSDTVGVKQILDKRGLQYNEICFDYKIIEASKLEEVKTLIYYNLGRGMFKSVYPRDRDIELYDDLESNGWNIYIDEGTLYINNKGVMIEDIISKEINKDNIKLEVDRYNYDCSYIVVTKNNDEFTIEYID